MSSDNQKPYIVEDTSIPDHPDNGFELRNLSQLGGTEIDDHEMRMLGRTQQLNVSIDGPTYSRRSSTNC
jgi:hypothetical protein